MSGVLVPICVVVLMFEQALVACRKTVHVERAKEVESIGQNVTLQTVSYCLMVIYVTFW